jgi:flagellar protein FliL
MTNYEETPKLSGTAFATESPIVLWLGVMIVLTLGAVAAGASLGLLLSSRINNEIQTASKQRNATGEVRYGGETTLRELPPIITNLAEPSDVWVRLQASIVFDAMVLQKPDLVAAAIGEDILGFLRTLSLAQIGGASGLQQLREDLNERASIRSEGLVRELIIQTLVVQ